jgi:hypothetical protein
VGTAYDTIKKLAGRRSRKLSDEPDVRLQLTVPAETVEMISKLAEQWGQSPVSAAGKLLAAGVHNHEIFIEGIALGRRLAGKPRGGGAGSTRTKNVRETECA